MADIITVRPSDLLVDAENPRLPEPNLSQREALCRIAEHQGPKLEVLAEDILRYGINPSDLFIVTSAKIGSGPYTVLEGNRRLSALKALENPEPQMGAVNPSVLAALRRMSAEYLKAPIDYVSCVWVKDKPEAAHWIELKHGGQRGGAGTVDWGSDEAARFRARSGDLEFHTRLLDFLQQEGALSVADRRKLKVTTFRRLVLTPEVRAKCGIEKDGEELQLVADKKSVIKALSYIVVDLIRGHGGRKATKVGDVYRKHQRVQYANSLPPEVAVKVSPQKEQEASRGAAKRNARKQTRPRVRDALIPNDCFLTISQRRIDEIADELRRLSLGSHTNAVAVLYRVFIELSVDVYAASRSLTVQPHDKLREKMRVVVDHLVASQKLTNQQASPVRTALQKGSFLAPSVDLLHDYVHNQNVFPAASDLRAHWNSLQPFMLAMWSP